MDWRNLLAELRRRGVHRVCAGYVVAAFALLQGADIVLPALGFPAGAMTLVVVLAIAGLPVAASLAWVFDFTARGIERTEPRPNARVSRTAAAGGVLAVVLLGLSAGAAAWVAVRQATRGSVATPAALLSTPGVTRGSVAVLPCVERAGPVEDTYFGDGMTEEIIGELARFEGLKVISRTSVMALRDVALTMPQIADTLGVQHVLECSVQRTGDRVRVRATLVDPHGDAQVWSEAWDRRIGDIVAVQEEIARNVGSALLARIPEMRPHARGTRSPVAAAYDAYLRGTSARRQLGRQSLLQAMAAFEEAIALDSSFAPAYSGLAQVHNVWALFGYTGEPNPYLRAITALRLADCGIQLDSTLADGWSARSHAGLRAWLDMDTVLADADRAVRLAPNAAEVRLLRGTALAFSGRFEEALDETAAAVALDPLAPGHYDFRAMNLVILRRYEEALRHARTARSLAPSFLNPIRQEMRALLMLGRFDECARIDPGPYQPLRAMCLHALGRTHEAAGIVERLAAMSADEAARLGISQGGLAGDIAEYHAWVGDVDATVEWLGRGVELSPSAQYLVHHTGTYDRVRDHPRFRAGLLEIEQDRRRRLDAAERRLARGAAACQGRVAGASSGVVPILPHLATP